MKKIPRRRAPLIEVRHSPIHGYGVFAARRIRKGTTVIEYLGDRVTHAEADARYEDKDPNDNHTFLFTVDAKTVIDAGVNGNEARYVNHGCDPNCESTTAKKRIFIEAIRTIQAGEELSYDYQIGRDKDDASNVDEIYACRCGAANCRGSMLEAPKKPKKPQKPKTKKPKTKKRVSHTAARGAAAGGAAKKGGARGQSPRRAAAARQSSRGGR
jgi:SET domain-containing protein